MNNRSKSIQKPIGIFDSGAGGLAIASAVKSLLPGHPIVYFGDSLHMPYGDKSEEILIRLTSRVIDFFIQKEVGAVLVACNSASTVLNEVKKKMGDPFPILDVIEPIVSYFRLNSGITTRALLVGTRKTIRSGVYQKKMPKNVDLFALETPLLAPLVEDGLSNTSISMDLVGHYLKVVENKNFEYCILGCTHYPLLEKEFKHLLGSNCEVLNIPSIVAGYLQKSLKLKPMEEKTKRDQFFCTDKTDFLIAQSKLFFGHEVDLEKVTIAQKLSR